MPSANIYVLVVCWVRYSAYGGWRHRRQQRRKIKCSLPKALTYALAIDFRCRRQRRREKYACLAFDKFLANRQTFIHRFDRAGIISLSTHTCRGSLGKRAPDAQCRYDDINMYRGDVAILASKRFSLVTQFRNSFNFYERFCFFWAIMQMQ